MRKRKITLKEIIKENKEMAIRSVNKFLKAASDLREEYRKDYKPSLLKITDKIMYPLGMTGNIAWPTLGRISKEERQNEDFGLYVGLFTFPSALASISVIPAACIAKGHPELLLIPVVTNALSGLYELGRKFL